MPVTISVCGMRLSGVLIEFVSSSAFPARTTASPFDLSFGAPSIWILICLADPAVFTTFR